MASLKKELKAALSRFDAAHEAFTEGTTLQKKNKKKLKSAKAKIRSLEQKVASLEQQLEVVRDDHSTLAEAMPSAAETEPKNTTGKKVGRRRSAGKSKKETESTASEMAEAMSEAPESVSAAAAETPAPKPRRGRPRKTTGAAKSARKSTRATKAKAAAKPKGTGRRGRPSTKGPASELTKIHGVGATMAKRFEEAGVTSIKEFSKLSDDAMSDVLQNCGPRYRNADHEKMENYREAAKKAMES